MRVDRVDRGRDVVAAIADKYAAGASDGQDGGLFVLSASSRAVPIVTVGFDGIAARLQYGGDWGAADQRDAGGRPGGRT